MYFWQSDSLPKGLTPIDAHTHTHSLWDTTENFTQRKRFEFVARNSNSCHMTMLCSRGAFYRTGGKALSGLPKLLSFTRNCWHCPPAQYVLVKCFKYLSMCALPTSTTLSPPSPPPPSPASQSCKSVRFHCWTKAVRKFELTEWTELKFVYFSSFSTFCIL